MGHFTVPTLPPSCQVSLYPRAFLRTSPRSRCAYHSTYPEWIEGAGHCHSSPGLGVACVGGYPASGDRTAKLGRGAECIAEPSTFRGRSKTEGASILRDLLYSAQYWTRRRREPQLFVVEGGVHGEAPEQSISPEQYSVYYSSLIFLPGFRLQYLFVFKRHDPRRVKLLILRSLVHLSGVLFVHIGNKLHCKQSSLGVRLI